MNETTSNHRRNQVWERLKDDKIGTDGAISSVVLPSAMSSECESISIPYTFECLHRILKPGRSERDSSPYRIRGAQLATMTFFAPTSFAIWMISLEVVPRTIESEIETGSSCDMAPKLTVYEDVFVGKLEGHRFSHFLHVFPPGYHKSWSTLCRIESTSSVVPA